MPLAKERIRPVIRVLFVEDDLEYARGLMEALAAAIPALDLRHTRSRAAAFLALEEQSFDLVICDLRIPTTDGALDEHVDHGLAVYAKINDDARGTPVFILSAFGTIELVREIYQGAPREDVFGTGNL